MKNEKGFSLIELLIVVAIILIIAAFAIPGLMNSIRSSHESSAVASVRSIAIANTGYNQDYTNVGYAAALANLGGDPANCSTGAVSSTAACALADNILASTGAKSGYTFTYTAAPTGASPVNTTFLVIAEPSSGLLSGRREFCIDQGNVVHGTIVGTPLGTITDDTSCNAQPTL